MFCPLLYRENGLYDVLLFVCVRVCVVVLFAENACFVAENAEALLLVLFVSFYRVSASIKNIEPVNIVLFCVSSIYRQQ